MTTTKLTKHDAPDPVVPLIDLIVEFRTAYGEALAISDTWRSEKMRVEAMPDCPPSVVRAQDRAADERYDNFMREHGVWALADRSTELWRNAGALANSVFASPARTVTEATEKLKILRYSVGDRSYDGDAELEVYQPSEGESWFASVMRDFERLAKGA